MILLVLQNVIFYSALIFFLFGNTLGMSKRTSPITMNENDAKIIGRNGLGHSPIQRGTTKRR